MRARRVRPVHRNRHRHMQIVAVAREARVWIDPHVDIQITGPAELDAVIAAAFQPHPRPCLQSCGQVDGHRLDDAFELTSAA